MSSPRHSGTAMTLLMWPPMIDSDDEISCWASAVRMAARSASTRRKIARLARMGSIAGSLVRPGWPCTTAPRARWLASVKRSLSASERSRIVTWVARGRISKVASMIASTTAACSRRPDRRCSAL